MLETKQVQMFASLIHPLDQPGCNIRFGDQIESFEVCPHASVPRCKAACVCGGHKRVGIYVDAIGRTLLKRIERQVNGPLRALWCMSEHQQVEGQRVGNPRLIGLFAD